MPPRDEQQQFRLRFRDALDDMRAGNFNSWDVLIAQFKAGQYSDQLELNAEWIIGELGERNSPDSVKLIDQLMNTVGSKSADLRGRLAGLKARILNHLSAPAPLPEPTPEGGNRKRPEEEEPQPQVEAKRPAMDNKMDVELPQNIGEDIWSVRRRR